MTELEGKSWDGEVPVLLCAVGGAGFHMHAC